MADAIAISKVLEARAGYLFFPLLVRSKDIFPTFVDVWFL